MRKHLRNMARNWSGKIAEFALELGRKGLQVYEHKLGQILFVKFLTFWDSL